VNSKALKIHFRKNFISNQHRSYYSIMIFRFKDSKTSKSRIFKFSRPINDLGLKSFTPQELSSRVVNFFKSENTFYFSLTIFKTLSLRYSKLVSFEKCILLSELIQLPVKFNRVNRFKLENELPIKSSSLLLYNVKSVSVWNRLKILVSSLVIKVFAIRSFDRFGNRWSMNSLFRIFWSILKQSIDRSVNWLQQLLNKSKLKSSFSKPVRESSSRWNILSRLKWGKKAN
jgi:hypothetical protein